MAAVITRASSTINTVTSLTMGASSRFPVVFTEGTALVIATASITGGSFVGWAPSAIATTICYVWAAHHRETVPVVLPIRDILSHGFAPMRVRTIVSTKPSIILVDFTNVSLDGGETMILIHISGIDTSWDRKNARVGSLYRF